MQTQRITFLTSPEHKAALDAYAARCGQSVGNVVREATSRYIGQDDDGNEAELAALVAQVNAGIPHMQASIEDMIVTIRTTREAVNQSLRNVGFLK